MVDSATSITENYTWNADGTLASSPGPSYTRNYVYDEEGRLLSIARGSTVAFQYGYAYDGGRRWRKDIANSVWTWYPCGVACSAGELVEQTSDLTGNTWTNSATYLRGSSCSGGLIRRNSEYHHAGLRGSTPIVTNSSGSVLSNKVYDSFGVQQFTSGTSAPINMPCIADEGYSALASSRNLAGLCLANGGINGICWYCFLLPLPLIGFCLASCSGAKPPPRLPPPNGGSINDPNCKKNCFNGSKNERDCVECCGKTCPPRDTGTPPDTGGDPTQAQCINNCGRKSF